MHSTGGKAFLGLKPLEYKGFISIMKKRLRLSVSAHNGWLNLTANLAMAFYQWGLLIILTRSMGQNEVGVYTYAIALVTPLVTWLQMQMRNRISTDDEGWQLEDFMRARACAIALLLLASPLLLIWQSSHDWLIATLPLCLVKCAELVSDFSYAIDQKNENLAPTQKSQMSKAIVAILVSGVVAFTTKNLSLTLWINAGILLFLTYLMDFRRTPWKLVLKTAVTSKWKTLVTQGLILGIGALCVALHFNIPRYFTKTHLGNESLAIFAVLFQFYAIAVLVVNALIQPMLPRMAKIRLKGRLAFMRSFAKLFSLASIAGIIVALIIQYYGNDFIHLLYGSKYVVRKSLINYLAWTTFAGILIQSLNYSLYALAKFKVHTLISISTLFVSVITAFIVPAASGLEGAILIFNAGLIFQALCTSFACLAHDFSKQQVLEEAF